MYHYDYIIAGAGCAGLSLALQLKENGLLEGKSLLLVDRSAKDTNDRTWCFWGTESTPFTGLATRKWSTMAFRDAAGEYRTRLAPQAYYLLSGLDFYEHARSALSAHSRIDWSFGEIQGIRERAGYAELVVDGKVLRGRYLFNSCVPLNLPEPKAAAPTHFLWQHFKGWMVQTPDPVFDPEKGTLMDFRVPQRGETRFGYVLPFSAHEALVEFTVFSKHHLAEPEYDKALHAYLKDQLGITAYSVSQTEMGAIPMTDSRFRRRQGERIFHIGTAGGAVKPTTGYAFQRIQKEARYIAEAIRKNGVPALPPRAPARFRFYDTLLLHILEQEGHWGKAIFSRLFRYNGMRRIFQFLSEESNLLQEMRLFATLPFGPFLRAVWATQFRALVPPSPAPQKVNALK